MRVKNGIKEADDKKIYYPLFFLLSNGFIEDISKIRIKAKDLAKILYALPEPVVALRKEKLWSIRFLELMLKRNSERQEYLQKFQSAC